jgi:hypothetical protein
MWRHRLVNPFKLQFRLESTFFGLTPEYKIGLTKEIYYLVKHARFSYESIMSMPIYERRIYLDYFQKEMEEQKREHDKAKSKKR